MSAPVQLLLLLIPSLQAEECAVRHLLLTILHALYHYLDAALFRICRDIESVHSILKLESMRNELAQIDDTATQ